MVASLVVSVVYSPYINARPLLHHCYHTITLPPHHYYHHSTVNIIASFTTSDYPSDLNACRWLWPLAHGLVCRIGWLLYVHLSTLCMFTNCCDSSRCIRRLGHAKYHGPLLLFRSLTVRYIGMALLRSPTGSSIAQLEERKAQQQNHSGKDKEELGNHVRCGLQ
jgi:hypothetical protein